jgi:predicted nucleic acid-binding protein
VVLDACVLMSSIIRPLLLRLADVQVFQPVWSARIGEEWVRNAARLWKVDVAHVATLWQELQLRFPEADAGDVLPYETGLRYSDPKDHHVIAAALAKRARCNSQRAPEVAVLTWNLKDFNRSELRRLGLDVFNPDRLLAHWWAQDSKPIRSALLGVAADVAAVGREPEPLDTTLHRERLHRMRSLVARTLSSDELPAAAVTPA